MSDSFNLKDSRYMNFSDRYFTHRTLLLFLLLLCHVGLASAQGCRRLTPLFGHWVGTWATAMQTPIKYFMPYNNDLTDCSVRQIVKGSVSGKIVRWQLSNIFSDEPVVIRSVYMAQVLDSFRIDPRTAKYLTFHNRRKVVMAAGQRVYSDAMEFVLSPLALVAITINYKSAPKNPTVHMGSRTTSYILKGASSPTTDFSDAFCYEKWFNIASLEVYEPAVRTIAILGNSITDGKGSTTNHQNRWPDEMSFYLNEGIPARASIPLSERHPVAVLNLGIGNNRVLSVGYGQSGRDRFDRDILGQSGVTDVILFEGINDLGTSSDGLATARELVEAYKEMIVKCHRAHLRVYLGTLMPMKGASYYSESHEAGRQYVNDWVRHQKEADGVLDFDKLMRATEDEAALRPEWRLPDCLHPNAEGYREMGRYAAEMLSGEYK